MRQFLSVHKPVFWLSISTSPLCILICRKAKQLHLTHHTLSFTPSKLSRRFQLLVPVLEVLLSSRIRIVAFAVDFNYLCTDLAKHML